MINNLLDLHHRIPSFAALFSIIKNGSPSSNREKFTIDQNLGNELTSFRTTNVSIGAEMFDTEMFGCKDETNLPVQ